MPSAEASGAICVQRFDDSRNSAIHTTYRISLRSSSLREPRYPLLRVVSCYDARRDRQPRDPPSENGITPTTSHPSNHGFRRVWYDWRAYVHDDAPTLLLPQPTRPRDVTSPDTTRPDQTQKPARAPAADHQHHQMMLPLLPLVAPPWIQDGSRLWVQSNAMILPQVHLRKPCYDFSFL